MDTNQFATLLKFLTDTLQQGKDFTIEQAPKFVQELLMWRMTEACLWIGVLFVFYLVAMFLFRPLIAALQSDDDKPIAKQIISLIATALFVFMTSFNVWTIVKIKVAPRVVVLEMVRDFIRSATASR